MNQLIKSVILPVILSQMLMFAGPGYSQPCVEAELFKLPGEWKAGLKGSTMNVSKESLAKEMQTVQSIFEIFKAGYNPMGCRVHYSGVYGFNTAYGKNWIANPYGLSMFFLNYACEPDNSGKHYVNISTSTSLHVSINMFQMERFDVFAAELPEDDETGYISIRGFPEYKDGYYYYVTQADYNSDIKTHTWIICYNGKLPFKHVTQKEYLQLTIADYKKKIQEINDRENATKNRGDKLTPEDVEFYNSQKEYFGKPIRLIEEMLQTKSVEELESPAAIYHPGDLQPFSGLVEMGTPDANILIKPNPDYFNKSLPKHVPQLFSINLKVQHGYPVFEDVFEKISRAVDIKKFKAMLGETFEPKKP